MTGCISIIREQARLGEGEDFHVAIHEIRRSTKRMRSILRLFRDEIGYSNYYRENRAFRDLSRLLSPVRDFYVRHQLVETIENRVPDLIPGNDFRTLQDHLKLLVEREKERIIWNGGGFENVLSEMSLAERRLNLYCKVSNGFNSVRYGLRRSYKQGHRMVDRGLRLNNAELLHEYRKRTKYLLFQMEVMQPLFPKLLKAYATAIEKHDKLLGEICDLDRLDLFLGGVSGRVIPLSAGERLRGKIKEFRRKLITRVSPSSHLIYAEKPGHLVKRFTIFYNYSFGFIQYKLT